MKVSTGPYFNPVGGTFVRLRLSHFTPLFEPESLLFVSGRHRGARGRRSADEIKIHKHNMYVTDTGNLQFDKTRELSHSAVVFPGGANLHAIGIV